MKETLEKTEVIKHTAAIHIENKMTYFQRFVWNVLFAQAFKELTSTQIHRLPLKDLCNFIGIGINNKSYLNEQISALVNFKVKWNILKKAKKHRWGEAVLLAGFEIVGDYIEYSFSPTLVKKLAQPEMYAKINLLMQRNFSSRYAIAIYEFCVDALVANRHVSKNYGETNWLNLSQFRQLMGIDDSEYEDFKRLNTRVIKEPLKEINECSDLYVKPEFRRENRKVAWIKFKIFYTPKRIEFPFPNNVDDEIVKELSEIDGLDPESVSLQLKTKPDYVLFCLDLLAFNTKNKKVPENPAGWLYKAITAEKEYTKPKGFKTRVEIAAEAATLQAAKEEANRKSREMSKAAESRKNEINSLFNQLSPEERVDVKKRIENSLDDFNKERMKKMKEKGKDPWETKILGGFLNQLLAEYLIKKSQKQRIDELSEGEIKIGSNPSLFDDI